MKTKLPTVLLLMTEMTLFGGPMKGFHQERKDEKKPGVVTQDPRKMIEGSADQRISSERGTQFPNETDSSLLHRVVQESMPSTSTDSLMSYGASQIADEKQVEQHYIQAQVAEHLWVERKDALPLTIEQQEPLQEATQAILYWQELGEGYTALAQTKSEEVSEKFRITAGACLQAAAVAEEFVNTVKIACSKSQKLITHPEKIPVAVPIDVLPQNQIEGLQENVIRKNISAVIKDFLKKSAVNDYLVADHAWRDLERGWEQQLLSQRKFQAAEKEEILFQKYFEECQRRTTEEELAKTRLGLTQKYAQQLATPLNAIPTPPTQLLGHGLALFGGGAGLLNKKWAKDNEAEAKKNYKVAEQKKIKAKEKKEKIDQNIVLLQEEADRREHETPELARKNILCFVEQLVPQEHWNESEWQTWSHMMAAFPEEVTTLANYGKGEYAQVRKIGFEEWHAALIDEEMEFERFKQEGINHVVTLKQQYLLAKQASEEASELVASSTAAWKSGLRREEELKQNADQLSEAMETQEKVDARKFRGTQNIFISTMKELMDLEQILPQRREAWEHALIQESDAIIQRESCLHTYDSAKIVFERRIKRVHARFEAIKAALIRYWPEEKDHLYLPYNEMALPFLDDDNDSFFKEELSELTSCYQKGEIEPPLVRREEEETQGKRYLYEAKKKIEEALNVTTPSFVSPPSVVSSPATAVTYSKAITPIKTIQAQRREPSFAALPLAVKQSESVASVKIIQTPEEQLLTWSLAQVEQSTLADQHRWKVFLQYENARREKDQLMRLIQEAKKEEKLSFNEAASSVTSWIGSLVRRGSQQTIGISSVATRSLISLNTQSGDGLDLLKLEEQLNHITAEEQRAKEAWEKAARQAEQERLARGGEALKEEDILKIWKYVDRAAVQEQQRQQRQLQHELEMERMSKKKLINNNRWRAFKMADDAAIELQKAEKELEDITDRKIKLRGIALVQEQATLQAKIERLTQKKQQTYEAWKKLAMQHESLLRAQADEIWNEGEEQDGFEQGDLVVKALKKLRGFDRGVLQCWIRFKEKQAHAVEVGRDEGESDEMLTEYLIKAEATAFSNNTLLQKGVKTYQQLAIEKALAMARENIPGAAVAWERRLREQEEKLKQWKQAVVNPTAEQDQKAGFQTTLPCLKAILKVDRKAKAQFEKEQIRLHELEWHWKNIIEKQKEDKMRRISAAALAYHQGNKSLWEGLMVQEREKYNASIRENNHHYDHVLDDEEIFLSDLHQLIEQELEKIQTFTNRVAQKIFTSSRAFKNFLLEAQSYYTQRLEELQKRKAERAEILRWSKMSFLERQSYVSAKRLEQYDLTVRKKEEQRRIAEEAAMKEQMRQEQEQKNSFFKRPDIFTISKFPTEENDQFTGFKFATCTNKLELFDEIQKLRESLGLSLLSSSTANICSSFLVQDAVERIGVTAWNYLVTKADEAFEKLISSPRRDTLADFLSKERALILHYEKKIQSMALNMAGALGENYWVKFVILSDRTAQLAEYNRYGFKNIKAFFQSVRRLRAIAHANRLAWYHIWPQISPDGARLVEMNKIASEAFKDLASSPYYSVSYDSGYIVHYCDRLALCPPDIDDDIHHLQQKAKDSFREKSHLLLMKDVQENSASKIYWDRIVNFFVEEASNCSKYGLCLSSRARGVESFSHLESSFYEVFFYQLWSIMFNLSWIIKNSKNEVRPESKTEK